MKQHALHDMFQCLAHRPPNSRLSWNRKKLVSPNVDVECKSCPGQGTLRMKLTGYQSLLEETWKTNDSYSLVVSDPTQPQILQALSTSLSNLSANELDEDHPPPIMKPVPVRVHPIKSSPPVQRNLITSTSQIRANLQANNASKNSRNISTIPPLRQSITPLLGKKNLGNHQPLGPQRSNSTLTPRVAPMAAISPVMDDGKIKNRAPSPDSPKHCLKRQSSCKEGEQGYESDFPIQ